MPWVMLASPFPESSKTGFNLADSFVHKAIMVGTPIILEHRRLKQEIVVSLRPTWATKLNSKEPELQCKTLSQNK